jgi:hypothetical protein
VADLASHPLEAAVVRLALHGAAGLRLPPTEPDVAAVFASLDADEPDVARYAAPALDALIRGAGGDERLQRMLGTWRGYLERRAGLRPAPAGSEEALRVRLEERLARIVAAMEQARDAGDEPRAQALHARYIELGTSYATRLAGNR